MTLVHADSVANERTTLLVAVSISKTLAVSIWLAYARRPSRLKMTSTAPYLPISMPPVLRIALRS